MCDGSWIHELEPPSLQLDNYTLYYSCLLLSLVIVVVVLFQLIYMHKHVMRCIRTSCIYANEKE